MADGIPDSFPFAVPDKIKEIMAEADETEKRDKEEARKGGEEAGRKYLPDPSRAMPGRAHKEGQPTEHAAAAAITPKSGTQRQRVLDHLRAARATGSTDFESGQTLGIFRHVAGTRREELIADGWPIRDSGRKRTTDTGNKAIVWVLDREEVNNVEVEPVEHRDDEGT